MLTFYAHLQGDRRKSPMRLKHVTLTREEILALRPGQHIGCRLLSGGVGQVKINGKIKTWKREPDRVEVPVKYGMYECARLSLQDAMAKLCRQVEFEAVEGKVA